jgi:hypothetical protein
MGFYLHEHPKGYAFTGKDVLFSCVTGLSGISYAKRHWELSQNASNKLGHRIVAIVEALPVIGAIAAVIEKISECIHRSNFTLGKITDLFTFQKQLTEMEDSSREEITLFENHIEIRKKQIDKFDTFIYKNSELYQACLVHLEENPFYKESPTNIPDNTLNENDLIDLRTKRLMEVNLLEHQTRQRMRFILSDDKVYRAFVKALGEDSYETESMHALIVR